MIFDKSFKLTELTEAVSAKMPIATSKKVEELIVIWTGRMIWNGR